MTNFEFPGFMPSKATLSIFFLAAMSFEFVILEQVFTDLGDKLKQYQIEKKVGTGEKINNKVLEVTKF